MRETSVFVTVFFYLLIVTHTHADYTITGCSSDGYIDVREDAGTTLTCDGINETENHNIYWALSDSRIGDCTHTLQCTLTNSSTTDYKLTRPTEARSDLRIQGNYRQKSGKNITCSRLMNQTAASCQINVIYPGLPTLPSLTIDNATWTVNGSYRVHKMYSSRNKYSCVWIMENDTQHEINKETVTPDLLMFRESDQEFYNGTCSFSWPLPTDDGRYTINLSVVPGEVNTSYSVDTFVIEYPADPKIQCVNRTAVESETYICQCIASATQPGKPAPSMSWPGFSNTSELLLVNVSRALNGTWITCQMTWGPNASVVKTVGFRLQITYKYTIPECSIDGYMDVREDTGTTITCDGIQGRDYNIYWALSGIRIGDCSSLDNKQPCSPTDNTDYNLTRPNASRSELRILGNFRSKANDTIMCSQRSNNTQVSCVINIVYPGRAAHPTLSTDGVTWRVSGSVRVAKIYSSRNQYSCIWTQENETQHEIKTEMVAPDLSIFYESEQKFYNGTCSFSWPLPTEEGNYTSYLTVVPGDGDKLYSAGTFIIEYPGDPEIHCDVRPVFEKSDVTCQCRPSSTKAGSPAPSLSWFRFSNSSQLRLTNLRLEDNGTRYTCQLRWGPNFNIVKTANYTLHLGILPADDEAASRSQAFPEAAIAGGVGAVIAVVIVAVFVVIVIVRRKRHVKRPQDTESINRNNDDEFEEHINIVYEMDEDLEESLQQPVSVPEPVAEALRTPLGNATAGKKTHDNESTDKDVTKSEADAGYYSIADDRPSPHASECGDQYQNTQKVFTNSQTPVAAVNKDSFDTQDKHGAIYANVGSKDFEAGNADTSQEDFYSVVHKTERTPEQRNDVSALSSTDQTNAHGSRGSVHAHVFNSSEPHDIDVVSTLEGRDTKMHQDTMTDKLDVTADPTAKAKPGQHEQIAVSQEDSPSSRATEDRDQTRSRQDNVCANGQISSGAARKGSEHVENKQEAMYANVGSKVAEVGSFGTSQGTFSADLDKPKKTPKQLNGVSFSYSTDQSNDQSHRAPIQQDTTTEKSTANAKPAAKAKPNAQPPLDQQNTSSAQSEASTGAGERIRTPYTRAAGQNYENVGAASARTPQDRSETTTDDEYNTLTLLNPHGARRQEPDPDYSHLSYL